MANKETKAEKRARYDEEILELQNRLEAALDALDAEETEMIQEEVNPLGNIKLFYAVMKISFLQNLITTKELLKERV